MSAYITEKKDGTPRCTHPRSELWFARFTFPTKVGDGYHIRKTCLACGKVGRDWLSPKLFVNPEGLPLFSATDRTPNAETMRRSNVGDLS